MFARCGKLLVVLALVLATGVHWAALQTIAWTTMLASNLRTQPVAEAVANTFDGEHPCPMCNAIAAGKKSEQKSEAVAPVLKLEFLLVAERIVLHPPTQFVFLPAADLFAESLPTQPPVPPPRSRFV